MARNGVVVFSGASERLPYAWNCGIEKESFNFKELEYVLIQKVAQLFGEML